MKADRWSVRSCWTWFSETVSAEDCPDGGEAHPVRAAAEYALGGDLTGWKQLISSVSDVVIQGNIATDLVSHLSLEGSRPPSVDEAAIQMETAGGSTDRSLMTFRTAPKAQGAVFWIRLQINAAIDDQCQLRLIHDEGYEEEILRFKSHSVIIARTQELFVPFIGADRLICIVADGPFLHVYIDGILCFRRARSRAECPTGFILDMNTTGSDGHATVKALGLASLSAPFQGLALLADDDDAAVPAILATTLLRQGRSSDFGKVCYAVSDMPLRQHADVIADAIAKIESPHEVSCDWITRPALDALPKAMAEREKRRIGDIIGDPMVSVNEAGVKFLANPADARSVWSIMARSRDHKEMNQVFRDISFDLHAGDTLGIIGHNGAGKTTLLRTIAGVIGLSHGKIVIRGESVLLRPGAGMRDDLTGRQNILLGSVFMGLSMSEAHSIMDDVIRFSELEDAIDRPYKYYSDGMRSRLIFSIATAMPPDILMLDELLGAGDLSFQKKANDRLSGFIDRAKVVIVVEHGLSFVATKCNKALYIGNNQRVFYGDPQICISQYMSERESEDRLLPYGSPVYTRPPQ